MLRSKFFFSWALLALFFVGFSSCDDDDGTETPPQTITEIAAGDTQFSTLVSLLQRVNLDATLNGSGSFTVFAPTNAAFTASGIDASQLTDEEVTEVLLYHVIGGLELPSADIREGQTYVTSAAETGPGGTQLSLLVEKDANGAVSVNGTANVSTADVEASNGVIHIIDNDILLPLDVVGHAAANSEFTSLVGALSTAPGGLVALLQADGPYTVFAPLNSAFADIQTTVDGLTPEQLATVLTYHVVPGLNVREAALTNGQVVPTAATGETFTVNINGEDVTITDDAGNEVNVVLTDVQATNGVIHVLDKVLLPF
ncbi:MAG: fasciclin domain-containing protein [Bacteroidota bacterium]